MWGIEFRGDTGNSLICAIAEFEVRARERGKGGYYRVRWHPDIGMAIDKTCEGGWETFKERAEPEDVEAILPNKSDYGHDWTYRDFMLAMTFWGEGHKRGYAKGEWAARKRWHDEAGT